VPLLDILLRNEPQAASSKWTVITKQQLENGKYYSQLHYSLRSVKSTSCTVHRSSAKVMYEGHLGCGIIEQKVCWVVFDAQVVECHHTRAADDQQGDTNLEWCGRYDPEQ
jgi:hypothetical protein